MATNRDVVYQFKLAIERATAKHRREHVEIPTPEEYIECWYEALEQAGDGKMQQRKPGRPKKMEVRVIDIETK